MARSLRALGRLEEALAWCEEAEPRFGTEADPPGPRRGVDAAIAYAGGLLEDLGRPAEAIVRYGTVVRRIGAPATRADRERLAWVQGRLTALVGAVDRSQAADRRERARELAASGSPDEALAILAETAERFGGYTSGATRAQAAVALSDRIGLLHELGRHEEVIAAADDLVRRFTGDGDETVARVVAWARAAGGRALVRRSRQLESVGEIDTALAMAGEVVARFGDEAGAAGQGDVALRRCVAAALVARCRLRNYGRRYAESGAAARDLLARFGDDPDPEVRTRGGQAFEMTLIAEAGQERYEAVVTVAQEALAWFGDPTEPAQRTSLAMTQVNRALALVNLGRETEAAQVFRETVVRFGPELTAYLDGIAKLLQPGSFALGFLASEMREVGGLDQAGVRALRDEIAALGSADSPERPLLERGSALLARLASVMGS
jgi:tetratricopeptide (TPR) repeat protein